MLRVATRGNPAGAGGVDGEESIAMTLHDEQLEDGLSRNGRVPLLGFKPASSSIQTKAGSY